MINAISLSSYQKILQIPLRLMYGSSLGTLLLIPQKRLFGYSSPAPPLLHLNLHAYIENFF
jgi:hypothetical protein